MLRALQKVERQVLDLHRRGTAAPYPVIASWYVGGLRELQRASAAAAASSSPSGLEEALLAEVYRASFDTLVATAALARHEKAIWLPSRHIVVAGATGLSPGVGQRELKQLADAAEAAHPPFVDLAAPRGDGGGSNKSGGGIGGFGKAAVLSPVALTRGRGLVVRAAEAHRERLSVIDGFRVRREALEQLHGALPPPPCYVVPFTTLHALHGTRLDAQRQRQQAAAAAAVAARTTREGAAGEGDSPPAPSSSSSSSADVNVELAAVADDAAAAASALLAEALRKAAARDSAPPPPARELFAGFRLLRASTEFDVLLGGTSNGIPQLTARACAELPLRLVLLTRALSRALACAPDGGDGGCHTDRARAIPTVLKSGEYSSVGPEGAQLERLALALRVPLETVVDGFTATAIGGGSGVPPSQRREQQEQLRGYVKRLSRFDDNQGALQVHHAAPQHARATPASRN